MTNIIRIKNASFYAYHGALQEERVIGGKFDVDVDMYFDFSDAAETDDLAKTINYDSVYKFIHEIIHSKKYDLIETIATVISDKILEKYLQLEKIAVRVRKNSVPVGGLIECVEAEVIKERNE